MSEDKEFLNQPLINVVPADAGGCGYYRLQQQAIMLQTLRHNVNLSPFARWRAMGENVLFTQRILTDNLFSQLEGYKAKVGCKVVIDYDDLIWEYKGESLPEYNICRTRLDCHANTEAMKKHLDNLADHVIVTTDALKDSLSQFTSPDKITVIPNMLSYKEWYFPQTPAPKDNIFMYAGSYTHYDNIHKLPGDFDKNLIHYLNNQKVIIKASCPYFIKPYKQFNASTLNTYAADFWVQTRGCRFILAPLAPNVFNTCKSDLKYLESAAVGRVCLVSDFEGSPYSGAHPYQKIPVGSTSQGIKYIVDRANEHYDEILKHQWDYLQQRWLNNRICEYINILR